MSSKFTGERGDADSYNVIDFNAGYTADINAGPFKSVDFAFVVNNVTSESYLAGGTGNGLTCFIGAPRTAAFTFTANF